MQTTDQSVHDSCYFYSCACVQQLICYQYGVNAVLGFRFCDFAELILFSQKTQSCCSSNENMLYDSKRPIQDNSINSKKVDEITADLYKQNNSFPEI